LKTIQDTC